MNNFFIMRLKNRLWVTSKKTVLDYILFSCLLILKLLLSYSLDGITCTTLYTGIFKNRFLPEDGYKYAGLICEYNEEKWKMCERGAYIYSYGFSKGSVLRRNSFKHKQYFT